MPSLIPSALAQKGDKPFSPLPVTEYRNHQVIGGLKIAAVAYERDDDTKPIFGKKNPNEFEVLPVLLVMENTGAEALRLDGMKVLYETRDREKLQPIAPKDLPYVVGVRRPSTGPSYPIPIPLPKKKNPLQSVEYDARSWAAKTLMANDKAYGFLYFWTRHQPGAILYISGIRESATGKEVFFAEVPIDPVP